MHAEPTLCPHVAADLSSGAVVATAAVAAAAVVTLGTFLPWLRSGDAPRSSYDLFSLRRSAGIRPVEPRRLGPAVVAGRAAVARGRRRRCSGFAAMADQRTLRVAVVYAAASRAVAFAPSTSLIAVEYGAVVTLVGA